MLTRRRVVLVNDLAGDVDTARREIEETWTLLTLDVRRRLNALGGMRLGEKRWEGE